MIRGVAIVATALALAPVSAFAEQGCSSRGGPGYRLPTGKCVSWAQHEKHKSLGDFPDGASCEHPEGCVLDTPAGKKRLNTGEVR